MENPKPCTVLLSEARHLDVTHMLKAINREKNNMTKQSLESLQAGEEGGRQEEL